MNINKLLLESINNLNRNQLVLGKAGCGKSEIIKYFSSIRNDVIKVTPTGIAAQNINGRTIQSFFNILPFTYTVKENNLNILLTQKSIKQVMDCKILLIDEISMIRCEILDIVDQN